MGIWPWLCAASHRNGRYARRRLMEHAAARSREARWALDKQAHLGDNWEHWKCPATSVNNFLLHCAVVILAWANRTAARML